MKEITEKELFEELINNSTMTLGYFSHDSCNVCKVLKPKVEDLLNEKFPKVEQVYCNVETSPEIAASNTVFTVPTILVWIEGKETYRLSRNIGLGELEDKIQRPYSMAF